MYADDFDSIDYGRIVLLGDGDRLLNMRVYRNLARNNNGLLDRAHLKRGGRKFLRQNGLQFASVASHHHPYIVDSSVFAFDIQLSDPC